MMLISLIPSSLQLIANRNRIEQNEHVLFQSRLFDANRNPIPNNTIDLFLDHTDYPRECKVGEQITNNEGIARFELTFRHTGDFSLYALRGSVQSPLVAVVVIPATRAGIQSWLGVQTSLGRFGGDLNTVIDQMIASGRSPTKKELCDALSLDYDNANDRNRVSGALYDMKMAFDDLWRYVYEVSPAFPRDFSTIMQDNAAYQTWQQAPNSPYSNLINRYSLSADEIHQTWVMSEMWERFVANANQFNLHLFVGFRDPVTDEWRYKQPNFWEYTEKQIQSASRLGKGMKTILSRHQDLGMMLASGEPVHEALRATEGTFKMITDTAPAMRCEFCWRQGISLEFPTVDQLYSHIKIVH
jgi:hypothetical protein